MLTLWFTTSCFSLIALSSIVQEMVEERAVWLHCPDATAYFSLSAVLKRGFLWQYFKTKICLCMWILERSKISALKPEALLPEQNFLKGSLLHAAREQQMCTKHTLRKLPKTSITWVLLWFSGHRMSHWATHLLWLKTKTTCKKSGLLIEPPSCCRCINDSLWLIRLTQVML